jgi:subtilisin
MFMLFTTVCNAQLKIGVLDSGFDFKSNWKDRNFPIPKLCATEHKDFTDTDLNDEIGHGTFMAGLIGKYAEDSDYCLVIVKQFKKRDNGSTTTNRALEYVVNLNVDIINISGGGNSFSTKECELIKTALNKGIIVIAAAGNESNDLKKISFYPAMCDKRVQVIANINKDTTLIKSSNYGDDVIAVPGVNIQSLWLNNSLNYQTGTSSATAIFTGKLIKLLNTHRRRQK